MKILPISQNNINRRRNSNPNFKAVKFPIYTQFEPSDKDMLLREIFKLDYLKDLAEKGNYECAIGYDSMRRVVVGIIDIPDSTEKVLDKSQKKMIDSFLVDNIPNSDIISKQEANDLKNNFTGDNLFSAFTELLEQLHKFWKKNKRINEI